MRLFLFFPFTASCYVAALYPEGVGGGLVFFRFFVFFGASMATSAFLTQEETTLLNETDKFIDVFKINTGRLPDRVTVSHKQMNLLRRILEKVADNPAYDFSTRFDLLKNTYRNIPIAELAKPRPNRKRKDMMELL